MSNIVLYIANRSLWRFRGFRGLISSREAFPGKIACTIGFSYKTLTSNCESFPANYSLILYYHKRFPP